MNLILHREHKCGHILILMTFMLWWAHLLCKMFELKPVNVTSSSFCNNYRTLYVVNTEPVNGLCSDLWRYTNIFSVSKQSLGLLYIHLHYQSQLVIYKK